MRRSVMTPRNSSKLTLVFIVLAIACFILTLYMEHHPKPYTNQQSQSVLQVDVPNQVDLESIELTNTELRPSSAQALTGDLRPAFIFSGRINNLSARTLRSVTIRVYAQSPGSPVEKRPNYNPDWQVFDQADIQVSGPLYDSVKGFSQRVQLLPPEGKKPWTWTAMVVDAKVE